MKEHPILCTGDEVRAILAGQKTQTRRVIDRLNGVGPITEFGVSGTYGYSWHYRDRIMLWQDVKHKAIMQRCPYGSPGDRLWVRETFTAFCTPVAAAKGGFNGTVTHIIYQADGAESKCRAGDMGLKGTSVDGGRTFPSIHMPRWASRITLEVTGVRVERVQDISSEDALEEGMAGKVCTHGYDVCLECKVGPRYRFMSLWNQTNIKRGYGWNENPWVWVITFERHNYSI